MLGFGRVLWAPGKQSSAPHTLRGALHDTGRVLAGAMSQLRVLNIAEVFVEALSKAPGGFSGNFTREG